MTSHPIPPLSPAMAVSATGSKWEQNAAAFFSLAHTQRRLAIKARRLAANAETADDARYYRAEAKRLWADAEWHDSEGRHHLELAQRNP